MPKTNNKAVRSNRREAAETRRKRYNALTTAEKIELAKSRRGNSARELRRLESEG